VDADLVAALEDRVRRAAAAIGVDPATIQPAVRRSDFADYQADLAMGLAKQLGQPPREVAEQLVSTGELNDLCAEVAVAGPGFLNLTLADDALSERLLAAAGDERLGVATHEPPRRVVVDYSAPNVAKEMHVGHLRSTVIGDALVRLLGFLGHEVIGQNHVGDWGTPFGMLIEQLIEDGEQATAQRLSVGELGSFYQRANERFTTDDDFAERARQRVVALHAGDDDTQRRWRLLVDASERYFSRVYDELEVLLTPDDLAPESRYNPDLPQVVADLEALGLAVESEGALCVYPDGFPGRDDRPLPLIVRKRDGGYGYATTDLAAVRYRTTELGADWLIYVVGAPQAQHLAMVFQAAREARWLGDDVRVDHAAFGSVLGEDGKMLRTRSGRPIRLAELLDEAVDRARTLIEEKDPDLPSEARAELARAVGIGAVKYADLSSDRLKDYTFSWDRMLSLQGNTAPYLQYAHTRIRSILRRAGFDGAEVVGTSEGGSPPATRVHVGAPAERALALQLLGFGATLGQAAELLQPHRICTYLFDLASAFTTFYEACPVLKAGSEELVASRLTLCALTGRTLATGLDLLGIRAPERM
jgi:arginyl-tRNA synthetase